MKSKNKVYPDQHYGNFNMENQVHLIAKIV